MRSIVAIVFLCLLTAGLAVDALSAPLQNLPSTPTVYARQLDNDLLRKRRPRPLRRKMVLVVMATFQIDDSSDCQPSKGISGNSSPGDTWLNRPRFERWLSLRAVRWPDQADRCLSCWPSPDSPPPQVLTT